MVPIAIKAAPRLPRIRVAYAILLIAVTGACGAAAQNESGGTDAGSCTLREHVYTCDTARFEPLLASAKVAKVDVHNADGVARSQLTALITKKLGKAIAADGDQPDLIFLLIPTEAGIVYERGDAMLGTLRVYSATPDGARGHLLWAEAYSGAPDLPWPAVVHRLIAQFDAHLKIR